MQGVDFVLSPQSQQLYVSMDVVLYGKLIIWLGFQPLDLGVESLDMLLVLRVELLLSDLVLLDASHFLGYQALQIGV